jgi:hypothetical protein
MKKHTAKRLPRKLVLRGEAIASLTQTQLNQVAGASWLQQCGQQSNFDITCNDDVGIG